MKGKNGDRVRIKTWKKMAKEFGLWHAGYINTVNWTDMMESFIPKNRIITVKRASERHFRWQDPLDKDDDYYVPWAAVDFVFDGMTEEEFEQNRIEMWGLLKMAELAIREYAMQPGYLVQGPFHEDMIGKAVLRGPDWNSYVMYEDAIGYITSANGSDNCYVEWHPALNYYSCRIGDGGKHDLVYTDKTMYDLYEQE